MKVWKHEMLPVCECCRLFLSGFAVLTSIFFVLWLVSVKERARKSALLPIISSIGFQISPNSTRKNDFNVLLKLGSKSSDLSRVFLKFTPSKRGGKEKGRDRFLQNVVLELNFTFFSSVKPIWCGKYERCWPYDETPILGWGHACQRTAWPYRLAYGLCTGTQQTL